MPIGRERHNPWSGPRLPIARKPSVILCFRCDRPDAIRFELRYAELGRAGAPRRVGFLALCGRCFIEANPPADPLDATAA